MLGLFIVAFQGTTQSWRELYFRTGLGWGKKKTIAESGALSFFYPYYYESCVPCISRMESEKPCSHSERRRGVLPRAGGRAGPSRGREAIIKNKNKKIEL